MALTNILQAEHVQFFPGYAVGFVSNSIVTPYHASPDHVYGYTATTNIGWQALSYNAYCPPSETECWDRNTTTVAFTRFTQSGSHDPSAPIPEPCTMLLFASGLVSLGAWRYHQRRQDAAKP